MSAALLCALASSCSESGSPGSENSTTAEGGANAAVETGGAAALLATAGAGRADEGGTPSTAEGGAVSTTTGGAESTTDGTSGESANMGGALGGEMPSCVGLPDGTYCGTRLAPPGEANVRHFCSKQVLLAKAACPAECQLSTNQCTNSTGTGQGLGDKWSDSCRMCLFGICGPDYFACDARCRAHLSCVRGCDLSAECFMECSEAFADEPLFDPLRACLETNCSHCL